MSLRETLEHFKEVTELFITEIKNDGDPEKYLIEREEIINTLKSMSFDKDDFKAIAKDIHLLDLEKEATEILNQEKEKIGEEIRQLKKSKEAAFTYGNQYRDIAFLNQKI